MATGGGSDTLSNGTPPENRKRLVRRGGSFDKGEILTGKKNGKRPLIFWSTVELTGIQMQKLNNISPNQASEVSNMS